MKLYKQTELAFLHLMMPLVFFQGFVRTILFNELNKVTYKKKSNLKFHFMLFMLFLVVRWLLERHQTPHQTALLLWLGLVSEHIPSGCVHNYVQY